VRDISSGMPNHSNQGAAPDMISRSRYGSSADGLLSLCSFRDARAAVCLGHLFVRHDCDVMHGNVRNLIVDAHPSRS
jgi:hypothetical protein